MELEAPTEGARFDRYEVLAELASGGMATVYLGRLAGAGGFERLVAIKRLHPHLERDEAFIAMFLDEARIAARIRHPNVVSTLDIGTAERGYFLVMDYVEGPTLSRLLSKAAQANDRLPTRVALRIVHDTLLGLHAAHELKDEQGTSLQIVHRDVSPQNILVGIDGTSRITDFGVARALNRLSHTSTGQLKGKLGYMSPEQARGEPVDRRADLFAVGIILWEALAGRRLFKGRSDTDAETLHRVLTADIPSLLSLNSDVPPALDAVVLRALERDVDKRFTTAAEFADALETAAPGLLGTARDVARYVENEVGQELAHRRESLRQMQPAALEGTKPDVPRLLPSSVSSATLSVAHVSQPPSGPVSVVIAPAPGKGTAVAIGVLAGALVVALSALALMWMFKPPVVPAAAPPATVAPVVSVSVPTLSASVAPAESAAAAVSASAAATSVSPRASRATPPPVRVFPTVAPVVPKSDGLQKNPYLQ